MARREQGRHDRQILTSVCRQHDLSEVTADKLHLTVCVKLNIQFLLSEQPQTGFVLSPARPLMHVGRDSGRWARCLASAETAR